MDKFPKLGNREIIEHPWDELIGIREALARFELWVNDLRFLIFIKMNLIAVSISVPIRRHFCYNMHNYSAR